VNQLLPSQELATSALDDLHVINGIYLARVSHTICLASNKSDNLQYNLTNLLSVEKNSHVTGIVRKSNLCQIGLFIPSHIIDTLKQIKSSKCNNIVSNDEIDYKIENINTYTPKELLELALPKGKECSPEFLEEISLMYQNYPQVTAKPILQKQGKDLFLPCIFLGSLSCILFIYILLIQFPATQYL